MSKRATTVLGRPAYRKNTLSAPRADLFMPPTRGLPMHSTPIAGDGVRPTWFFVAAHGGTGASLLAKFSRQAYETALKAVREAGERPATLPAFGMAAGRAWPNPAQEPTGISVVVCQTTMRGLAWARDLAAQYLSGRTPAGTHLLGVVTVADQPGRLPQPIAAAKNLLGGAYAHSWHVPYVPEYRLLTGLAKEECPPIHPGVEDVLAAIRTTTNPEGDPA